MIKEIQRKENCRLCGHNTGSIIADIDYWDIKSTFLVKCSNCGLAQLDPMLTEKENQKGCEAYYIYESFKVSVEEQKKNQIRNFRRGVLFAHQLKKIKHNPKKILELGPGSGYFSAGIRFVFPDIKVEVMDIVKEVLDYNKKIHGFSGYLNTPENFMESLKNNYDLVIARDIIEHLSNAGIVIKYIQSYLKPGGLFHFITPNGHEDSWPFYVAQKIYNKPSELLINHVNYFDGGGLEDFIKQNGFKPIRYYTYKIKTTIKGKGWKISKKLAAPISEPKNANEILSKRKDIPDVSITMNDVMTKWYISNKHKWLTLLYSWYQHHWIVILPPSLNRGHEIFGLFRKA